jgi:hypothetical protein
MTNDRTAKYALPLDKTFKKRSSRVLSAMVRSNRRSKQTVLSCGAHNLGRNASPTDPEQFVLFHQTQIMHYKNTNVVELHPCDVCCNILLMSNEMDKIQDLRTLLVPLNPAIVYQLRHYRYG